MLSVSVSTSGNEESPMETQHLFCTFRLEGDLFGVNILDVKEVTTETSYTRIAHAPNRHNRFLVAFRHAET